MTISRTEYLILLCGMFAAGFLLALAV